MSMMKTGLLALALACAGASSGAAQAANGSTAQASGESVMTMRVDGDLTIDTEGAVKEYSLRTQIEPKLQQMLAEAIPKWRLAPVQLGGKPVNAKTPMRITLLAKKVKAGYEVKIDNVVFAPITAEDRSAQTAAREAALAKGEAFNTDRGEGPLPPSDIKSVQISPPRYPAALIKAGVEGMVLLNLRLNPDGTVAEAFAVQSSLLNIRGGSSLLNKVRAPFEQESLRAARNWTFTVRAANPAALDAEDLTVRMPITFLLDKPGTEEDQKPGSWRYELRGPYVAAPWKKRIDSQQLVGVSDLSGSEQVQGSSPFRLRDRSVLGQTL